jgi:hypothetical protein
MGPHGVARSQAPRVLAHVDRSLQNFLQLDELPTLTPTLLALSIKNTGALRNCASMKPKYLPIRARPGRFLG